MSPSVLSHYIDGENVGSADTFLKRSPVNGAVSALCADASAQQVEAAVSAARRAYQNYWGNTSAAQRSFALHRLANVMQARSEEFVAAICADSACSAEQARAMDVSRSVSLLRYYADLATTLTDHASHTPTNDGEGAQSFSRRHSLGIVALLAPATFPLFWISAKLAPALAAGNTVVLKSSEHAPATANMISIAANESGLKNGIINVVHGLGEGAAGEWLASHVDVNAVSLVGASATARAVSQRLALPTTRFLAETGGRNAAVIAKDADFSKALAGVFKAAFFNTGQTCFSVNEIFVHRTLYEKFLTAFRAAAGRIQLAPMISVKHREATLKMIRYAQNDDARIVFGGAAPKFGDARDLGAFLLPTILTGIHDDAPSRQSAVFGPVCHVSAFDNDEELLVRLNKSPWVSASVWSEGLSRVHRLAPKIRATTVWVNTWMLRDWKMPTSGSSHGGNARDAGLAALEAFSATTSVTIKL